MTTKLGDFYRSVKEYHGIALQPSSTTTIIQQESNKKEESPVSLAVVLAVTALGAALIKGFTDALGYSRHVEALRQVQVCQQDQDIDKDSKTQEIMGIHSRIAGERLANAKNFLASAATFGCAAVAQSAFRSHQWPAAVMVASLGFSTLSSGWHAWRAPNLSTQNREIIFVRAMKDFM